MLESLLLELGNSDRIMLAALVDIVLEGPPNPPVKSYETDEKKLGIRTSESITATTQAAMIHRRRLRMKLFSESKNDPGNLTLSSLQLIFISTFHWVNIASSVYFAFLKDFP